MNTNLNQVAPAAKGGTNAIYGVDGSPVQHDIWFESPHDTNRKVNGMDLNGSHLQTQLMIWFIKMK